jgi:carboxyl-terminal processing protease
MADAQTMPSLVLPGRTLRRAAVIALTTLLLAAGAAAPPRPEAAIPQTVQEWATLVWEAARSNRALLDDRLRQFPEVAGNEQALRVRAEIEQYHDHARTAIANRDEARAKAETKMKDELAAGEISRALTAAVEVQTLSEDMQAALGTDPMRQVVERARAEIPAAEQGGDWLFAYEILYRLNVLFEQSGEFRKELDRVNDRLALLTHYAPRYMHDLRARLARRSGEEPVGEFNPALAQDWKQRVEDINVRLVRRAMETAATEHIEDAGWRPLLHGALDNLRLLGTTPQLVESFPSLADEQKVKAWLDFVDESEKKLAETADGDLNNWYCARLLDRIGEVSDQTIALPKPVLFREFGDGAMHDLDEFSEIIWPDKLRRFRQSTQGSFVGVGIVIRHDEKRDIMVVSPVEGTPAYFAGIKPADRIVEVDGIATAGWSLNDAVDRITGQKGTEVALGIRREGVEGTMDFTIVRDVIKIRSVWGWWKKGLDANGEPIWDWLIDPDTRVAYIKLTGFNEDTYEDLKRAWTEIKLQHGRPNGLILDMRYNPGGLLTAAVDVSNLFVHDGMIVSVETKEGMEVMPERKAEPHKAEIGNEGVPTVVLINEGSASAAEIVAGCLKAHGSAIVVGKRSFGKGSVQTVHTIPRSNALLKLTTQYYRLPPDAEDRAVGRKGRLVHKRPGAVDWGVDPDIEVQTTPQEIQAAYDLRQAADIIDPGEGVERPDINGLINDGVDPQLETALLILQARALYPSGERTQHARK